MTPIELGQTLSKKEFKSQERAIRPDLLTLQNELAKANIATLIIVAGVEGAGKGEVVDRLNKWLDSRQVETHAFWDETDEEVQRPSAWRFWKRLPQRGHAAIMFGGWYWDLLYDRAHGRINGNELEDRMTGINDFERMLFLDGLLLIKLWFHLSRKEFEKCMKKRREVNKHIRSEKNKKLKRPEYDVFLDASKRIVRYTNTGECPWKLIEADDKRFRDISVARTLITRMEEGLKNHGLPGHFIKVDGQIVPMEEDSSTVLDEVDLSCSLPVEDYEEQLEHYQSRLNALSWEAYDAGRSTLIVFEGWDAAGKGGVIRRLTDAIDARLYRVISITAPSDEELAHNYLWRFWRHVPRDGYMTLYDRSWYGRILVERVEGFAQPNEWKRAYQEINDFEKLLTDHGTVLIKFWLHISPEEQLNRFREREKTAWKQHKITKDDWRNREKWDEYKSAVNTMISRTSIGRFPWTLVPANDKLYARVEVIKTVCKRLEEALKK